MVSIPIARSINPVDAVGFTGLWVPKSVYLGQLLDANGRDFPSTFSIGREFWDSAVGRGTAFGLS